MKLKLEKLENTISYRSLSYINNHINELVRFWRFRYISKHKYLFSVVDLAVNLNLTLNQTENILNIWARDGLIEVQKGEKFFLTPKFRYILNEKFKTFINYELLKSLEVQ